MTEIPPPQPFYSPFSGTSELEVTVKTKLKLEQ